jgi:hypothetical protein
VSAVIGACERAKQVRQAAVRLRRECEPDAQRPAYDLAAAAHEIAETLAVLRRTVELIDEALPDERSPLGGQTLREQFAADLAFYADLHRVMR